MRKRYTAADRERFLAAVKTTGEKARVVAGRLGVTPSTAYLWLKAARETPGAQGASVAPSSPRFARVVRRDDEEQSGGVVVQVGSASIRVEAGFDAALLRNVVVALSEQT